MSGGPLLESMLETQVSVITNDGRVFVGALKGFDQTVNIVLHECQERVYSSTAGVETVSLGLYVIRGENICVIGEVDEEVDSRINLATVRAHPLKPVMH